MQRPYLLHALSPLHAGTGHAAGVIDLPIARMAATGIPFVPGSSVKGVLRDHRRPPSGNNDPAATDLWLAAFGPEKDKASEHAGALVIGDARLLALPVRSFIGTFAWVTSPLLLRLAKRDLGQQGSHLPIPTLNNATAMVAASNAANVLERRVYLQDLDLAVATATVPQEWSALLRRMICGSVDTDDIFSRRFVIVDDETMTFLWDHATQIDQRIRMNEETRTVDEGALWIEESLPPETLLIGLMEADRSRRRAHSERGCEKSPEQILKAAIGDANAKMTLQFGGKASIGRGRCQLMQFAGA